MRHIKTLVLLIGLFPTTTFADSFSASDIANKDSSSTYNSELEKLNNDSNQLAAKLLQRGTDTGTTRAPASEGFQVTLIKVRK